MDMTRYGCGEKAYIAMDGVEGAARDSQIAACSFTREWPQARAILEPCGAFEWVALLYLGISGALMLIFHENLSHPVLHITMHFGVFAAILVIVNVADRVGRGELSQSRIAKRPAAIRKIQAKFF